MEVFGKCPISCTKSRDKDVRIIIQWQIKTWLRGEERRDAFRLNNQISYKLYAIWIVFSASILFSIEDLIYGKKEIFPRIWGKSRCQFEATE